MRTSYKTLKNIINSNFTVDDIRKSPGQGEVVVFTEGVDHVRIVLVDGNSYSNEIGIHIRCFTTREELESSLVDACETALKDNYPTIWVHNKPRPNEDTRKLLVASLKEWFTSGKTLDIGQLKYSLNKKCIANGEEILETLNQDQLSVVLAMVSSAYGGGCSSTRAFFIKSREAEKQEQGA